ncbi:hypothetical protein ALC56_10217 [Trachymyrmex septentrionalis]|uniref:Uncharacterized protein n=1 Tax=Trachymyrmex septentrionalis TaxID=34720 RepID=A0A195F5C8_9HYME|nr:PREDICTED: uncharacterized protein LOC108751793 [Trachymyrmex septentrionalis]KYN35382.1 hypothetical protein ALC56_10217 [Trachymyrmex septentrionalis]
MFFMLSRILSRSNCILILIIFNLASSAPLKSQRNSPYQNEQGFSASPKILEIQLPLKITSKEDLVAWSKYVMSLMASKINLPSIFKNSVDTRLPFTSNSGSKSKEIMKKASLNEKRQGVNYPARRLKEPPLPRPDDKVVAYPMPIGAMQTTSSSPQDPSSLSTLNINGPTNFGQYMDFNIGNPFQQSEIDTFGNFDAFLQPPANTYLPLPQINIAQSYQKAIDKNISDFEEPAKLQTTRNSLNLHIHNNELQQALPTVVNNGLTGLNLSHNIGVPLLTFPFQAVITIAKELPIATMIPKMQPKDYTTIRDFPNEFLPYFENDYTFTNNSEGVNVVFNDFTETSETKTEGKVKKGKQKEEQKLQNINEQKKQNQKKIKSTNNQKSSIKRQSAILGDLLRTLGILRKLPKNSTEINVAKPVLSILKGTNTQKIQVAFEETPPNRGRRNETFQAQQLSEDDDENDDNGNGANGNGDNENDDIENDNDDDDGPQTEAQEEDEEEEGGSIQALIELLPLAAPILEELSDPESDVDIAEVLQGAIPLLEGLSDPAEEGGVDIPAVLLPLSQKLSEGPEGQGSDSGAILGPIIQLIAPLSGPLSGPLIGPLSRSSSGPEGVQGSASVFAASGEPLSKPQGPYGQSVLSGLIAGITAKLSKESAASASESDVKSLVSSIVTGVLAGASTGSKGHKSYGYNQYGQYGNAGYGQNGYSGNRDTSHASTTYDGYNSYGKPEAPSGSDLTGPLKEVLGAFLKLSATSATSSANLSGTSSSSSAGLSASSSQSSQEPEKPTYGPPTNPPYSPPPSRPSYAVPPSTNSPYVSFTRRQVLRQPIKKI